MTNLFDLGQTVITPGARDVLDQHPLGFRVASMALLRRHLTGDWGDMDDHDKKANDRALDTADPARVFSAYNLPKGERVWVITEWDRSSTCILLPEEY